MKEKLAVKLFLTQKELVSKNIEIEKVTSKLIDVNKELTLQKEEKNNRELQLAVANKRLIFKTQERQLKTAELNIANRELNIAEERLKNHLKGLAQMMFITSHKVRQPIANILGFSKLLDESKNSPEELKLSLDCIKNAAITLDVYRRELTEFIFELSKKEKQ